MSQPKVTLEPCGQQFRHSKSAWSIVLPLEHLPSWTDFYRRLRDRKGGQFSQHYAADVEALEHFASEQITKQKDEVAA